jgi:hypothetical protein
MGLFNAGRQWGRDYLAGRRFEGSGGQDLELFPEDSFVRGLLKQVETPPPAR